MVKMRILQGILLIIVQMLVIKIMLLIFMHVAVMALNVDQSENILSIFQNNFKISKDISNNDVDIYASSGHGP